MKRILFALLLSAMVLSGCDRKDLVLWSPDGKRVAIIASEGLKLGDETGRLSEKALVPAAFCRWLPDSIHAVVVSVQPTYKWQVVKDALSITEERTVKRIAERVWKSRALPNAKSVSERLQQSEALLYLLYIHGRKLAEARLAKSLKDSGVEFAPVEINTLQMVDLSGKIPAEKKFLFHTTQAVKDVTISPKGTLAAVCVEDSTMTYRLLLVATKGGRPIIAVDSLADCPAWSLDGKSIFYIAYPTVGEHTTFGEMNDTSKHPFVAAVNCLEVAHADGTILAKLGNPKKLVDLCAADASRVRCLPDGSIVFHAKKRAYPSIAKMDPHACLFRLSPDFQTIEPIAGSTELPGDAMQYFEPNQDGTKIAVPGTHGEIAVLDVSSGKVITLEKAGKEDLKLCPQWRTKDELCYGARNVEKSANGHDVEVVLQSVTQPDQRIILSKDWSASSVEFLKDSEDPKREPHKTVPGTKSRTRKHMGAAVKTAK
jgi:hypothetical protein